MQEQKSRSLTETEGTWRSLELPCFRSKIVSCYENEEVNNCHGKEVGITAVGEREKPIENPRLTRATLY